MFGYPRCTVDLHLEIADQNTTPLHEDAPLGLFCAFYIDSSLWTWTPPVPDRVLCHCSEPLEAQSLL